MQRRKRRRLVVVCLGVGALAAAVLLALSQIGEHVTFFRTPSELAAESGPGVGGDGRRMRLGGLVEEGSVERLPDGVVRFRVTDLAASTPVRYQGVLPDLFREGQGVVVEGRMQGGVFAADGVLAKHDENYMPPEAAEALKRSGQWRPVRDKLDHAGQLEKGAAR